MDLKFNTFLFSNQLKYFRLICPNTVKSFRTALTIVISCSLAPVLSQSQDDIQAYHVKANLNKYRNQFDSSLYFYGLLHDIYNKTGDQQHMLKVQIEMADLMIQKRDFHEALLLIKSVESLIDSDFPEDKDLNADMLQTKGSYFLATGNPDSAKMYLESAIAIRTDYSSDRDTLLHYAWNKLGNYHLTRGDHSAALACYRIAFDLASLMKNPDNYLSASTLQNMGIAFTISGDFKTAENYFLKSLTLNERIYNKSDPSLASIYINLGKFYSDLSKYDFALKYYDKAEAVLIHSDIGSHFNKFVSLYWNKGNLFTLKGEYEKAISYLNRTLSLFEITHDIHNRQIQAILMDLGVVYEKKKDLKLAIEYYLRSTQNQDIPSIVKSYRNLGNSYARLNLYEEARKYYKFSIAEADKFHGRDSYDMALCYQYYGELLAKFNNDSALFFYTQSLDILKKLFNESNRDIAKIQLLIGEYYYSKNQPDNALQYIQPALGIFIPGIENSTSPEELSLAIHPDLIIPDGLNLRAKALYQQYLLYEQTEMLEESLFSLRLSSMIISKIRVTYDDEESQIILNNNARETIDLGVKLSWELYKLTGKKQHLSEAFQFSEKGKALILLSALRGLEAESSASIPIKIKEREKLLTQELATYNNLIYNESKKKIPDSLKIGIWNEKLFRFRQSFDSLITALRKTYPDYFGLRYDYSVIHTDSVLKHLPADQALLSFHLTDAAAYGFVMSGNEFVVKELGATSILTNKLDSLNSFFISRDYFNSSPEDFKQLTTLSFELYDFLIRPFKNHISDKRIVIIPDGKLGLLAFDMLLTDVPDQPGDNYQGLSWLILQHAMSYSSSASIYFSQQQRGKNKKPKENRLLAFAPSYDYHSLTRDGNTVDSAILNLSALKWAKEEVNAISKIFYTQLLFDDRASEENFKNLAGHYDILHLAMHTVIDNQKPLYSKLIFSSPENFSPEDGFLNTYELFNLNLKGELAVLSACNTGSGKLEKGEGVISLARGFFYAGIPSVVMTLWEIEDYSSANLLPVFYENLTLGMTKDVALQQAKLNYLEQAGKLKSHPYFWAAFISYGQPDPIIETERLSWPKYVTITWIILFVFLSAYLFINRRVFFRKIGH